MADDKKNVDQPIQKAESNERLAVPTTTERGQPGIITSTRFINDAKLVELSMENRFCTFDEMYNDEAVYSSIFVTNLFVKAALHKGKFVSKGSAKSKIAADFLNYCIRNMTTGTWLQAINNMCTDIRHGFSLLNMVTEIRKTGPYAGSKVLKKLSPRDQKSIHSWLFDAHGRELVGIVQKPNIKITPLAGSRLKSGFLYGPANQKLARESKYPVLTPNQVLHFTYNSTNNNPQGDSPLMHCFNAWKEKKLVESYEVIGVSKDLGGALVLRVPSTLIEKANDPANNPNEAAEYKELQRDAGDLHNGKSTYIVLTSDRDASGNPDYDITFQGIEGGGKQYSTSDIIEQKKKAIYNTFGAGFLILGQDSVGSYSLSSSATSTHGFFVQDNINEKVDVLNTQMAPRLLAANNIFLDFEDMPTFEAGEPNELDLELLSKTVQRMKSTGALTEEALTHLYEKAGLPIEGIDELTFDDGDTSRGGEGGGTSGIGSTQSGGASTDDNAENTGNVK